MVGAAHLPHDACRVLLRVGAALADPLEQLTALGQLEHDEGIVEEERGPVEAAEAPAESGERSGPVAFQTTRG